MKKYFLTLTVASCLCFSMSSCNGENTTTSENLIEEENQTEEVVESQFTIPMIAENCEDVDGVEGEPPVGYSGVAKECGLDGKLYGKTLWVDNQITEWGWYQNGSLYQRKSYVNGKQEGEDLQYFSNGTLNKKRIFKNGELKEYTYYTMRGEITEHNVY